MKTFDKTYIRVLDYLLGVEKHLSVFFLNSLYLVPVKSMVEISQNFVAFSEYMNFTKLMVPQVQLYTATVLSSQKPELNFVVLLIPKRGVNLQIFH